MLRASAAAAAALLLASPSLAHAQSLIVDENSGNSPFTFSSNATYLVVFVGVSTTGVINHSAGTVTITNCDIGVQNGSTGTYNLSGTGVLTVGNIDIGSTSSTSHGTGFFNQTGGTHTVSGGESIGFSGNGTYTQSGGTHTSNGGLNVGSRNNFSGTYILTAGTLSAVNVNLGGDRGVGTFTQSGGTNTISGSLAIGRANIDVNPANSTYNLNGGTLAAGQVTGVDTSGGGPFPVSLYSTFNFNGGTLQARADSSAFFQKVTQANVQAGGAKIASQGFNVTIPQVLRHDPALGATADGGLTKSGAGTLTLTLANTYTGPTTVSGGTVAVSTGRLANTDGIVLNNGGTLSLSGSTAVTDRFNDAAAVNIKGGGTLATGGLDEGTAPTAPGGAGGAAGWGALTFSTTTSIARATIDFANTATGSTLVFSSLPAGSSGAFVRVLNWTGTPGADSGAATNDRLLFQTNPGLTPAQLANFQFSNDSGVNYPSGAVLINYNGYYELVPQLPPQAPAITSANATTFTVGSVGTFTVTATGIPTATVTQTGTLPTGVTFDSATNTLSGTPAAGTGGTYPITFTASNGVGSNAVQSFTLTVNQPPAITSANATTFTVGSAGTFTVTTTGVPVPTVTQTGTLPSGVTFNSATRTLSGTPAAGAFGTYPISFTASNGVGGNAAQSFTLTVNQAPAITSANSTTFTVGTAGTFTVTVTGFPAPSLSEGGTLPSGVTFNSATGVLSGTPGAGTGGAYPIFFFASNGVGSNAVQSFTLTVNQPPAITSANSATFTVGTAGTFTVAKTGFPAPTLSQSGTLPSGVTFTAATGVLSGTPAASTGGAYPLTFTAGNGVGSNAVQSFTLTVNQAPAITSANAATFVAGSAGSATVTTTGFPNPTVSQTGVLPSGVTFNAATRTLSGTPAAGTGGTYPITFTATNGVGSNATQNFTLTVNAAPSISSASSTTFTEGNFRSFPVTATGFPAPTFSATGTLPSGVTFTPSGVLSGTPATGTAGSYPLQITASNGVGSNDVESFTLTVLGPACVAPLADLVAWYAAEGNAIDVKSGYNGAALNGAAYANGKAGQGFTFNGSTSVIEVPNAPAWNFGANNFTVQTWVKFAALSGSDVLVGHSQGTGSVNKWLFWLKSGKLEFHLNGSAVANITSDANFAPVLGRWYHVAVTRTANTYKFYVDGVQNGTDRFDSNTVPVATVPLSLGKAEALPAMNGSLDEVQIFSRALTLAEIQSVYNASTEGFCVDAPAMLSAVSRKVRAAAGTFDINLPLTGTPGVECRTGSQTIVVRFNNTVTEGNVAVSAGSVSGTPTFSGNTMTINLASVPNAQRITLTLTNVKDAFAQVLPNASVPINVLLGDTNGSGGVNATDIGQTKAGSGQPVGAANFRQDLNVSGSISASDIGLVKAQSGTSLP